MKALSTPASRLHILMQSKRKHGSCSANLTIDYNISSEIDNNYNQFNSLQIVYLTPAVSCVQILAALYFFYIGQCQSPDKQTFLK